ncbi:LytTR family transcriptional regulator DNA-binding domain-containing protein [Alkalicoccus luteus]|uniref:ABC transporter ATP-binding protein n=1 Tax=Alkalicoccus luteus TaxID=1237094 RepID=A0A969PXE8_9BACI|nr:LytTR family transcriptional regulator DNA-binding domain-containing protein [Alkalicoccus luteus]NJP37382.1 ABC transporter ATP-binding protein [Alkalicoccus luteus]
MAELHFIPRAGAGRRLPELTVPLQNGAITACHAASEHQLELIQAIVSKEAVLNERESEIPAGKTSLMLREEGLYPKLTVKDQLTFYKRLHQSDLPVKAAAEAMQLLDCYRERIDRLSYSVQRRICASKMLFQQASVYIIEEMEQNVDTESRKIIRAQLRKLADSGSAVLLLTSVMESAVTAADTIYRLNELELKEVPIDTGDQESDDPAEEVRFSKIPAKLEDKMVLFDPPEIDYIESRDSRSYICINNEAYPCAYTLQELEEKLKSFGFFRCHRSYIVNLQKVREVITWTRNSYSLQLANKVKTEVPLSKQKLDELRAVFGL